MAGECCMFSCAQFQRINLKIIRQILDLRAGVIPKDLHSRLESIKHIITRLNEENFRLQQLVKEKQGVPIDYAFDHTYVPER